MNKYKTKSSAMYNPFGNFIEKLHEKQGFIKFKLGKSNLFDKEIPLLKIFEVYKNQTVFVLERDDKFNLKFIQSNSNYNTKIAEINILDLDSASELVIILSWSEKRKNRISVGAHYGTYKAPLRRAESSEYPNIKFRVGKDGNIYRLGDEGVKVTSFRVQTEKQTILEEGAREVFESHLDKIKILIENCKKGDFLFEATLTQLVIVLLVTMFEVYTRTRFIELEKEGKFADIQKLYNCFKGGRYRDKFREEIREIVTKTGEKELQAFVDTRVINFQDWESFKKAYNKGYNLKIETINISNDDLIEIQKIFKWRHRIIHSKDDQTVINWAELPLGEEPILTDKDLAERSLNTVCKFIKALHESTLKL